MVAWSEGTEIGNRTGTEIDVGVNSVPAAMDLGEEREEEESVGTRGT
jgi:hypothetical protein